MALWLPAVAWAPLFFAAPLSMVSVCLLFSLWSCWTEPSVFCQDQALASFSEVALTLTPEWLLFPSLYVSTHTH